MKLNSQMKKLLFITFLIVIVCVATGCTAPVDENKQTIYIWNEVVPGAGTFRTSFREVLDNESWFQALIVYPLCKAINVLAPKISVGLAIAVVTILVNAVLAAFTIKSSIAQQQMQLIQPELNKIQRKYEGKDDQASKMRYGQEVQALYNKYDINPLSTMLVMFIQFPIIIAMYQAVHRSYAVQSGVFLGMTLQNTPMVGFQKVFSGDMSGIPYIILFLVMISCQFLSMQIPKILQRKKAKEEAEKHHKKPPEKQKDQTQIMSYYFFVMISIFGLMWPSAMSLYWAINSMVNIAKTLIVQKIIDNKQEGQKAGA